MRDADYSQTGAVEHLSTILLEQREQAQDRLAVQRKAPPLPCFKAGRAELMGLTRQIGWTL